MDKNKLNFKGGNPGAVQHGNFINYYQFHPPDKRIKLLPLDDVWTRDQPIFALDLGCNAGDLTLALYDFLTNNVTKNCDILGVDIDPTLIQRAIEKNTNKQINFACLDFMNAKSRDIIVGDYFQTCSIRKFSVVFCFSITMWIHLNNGDEGLKDFLREVSKITELLVIEPQPWKCYKTAVKRMKLSNEEFPHFEQLKLRENIEKDIESFLTSDCALRKVWESPRTDWRRKLLFFKTNTT